MYKMKLPENNHSYQYGMNNVVDLFRILSTPMYSCKFNKPLGCLHLDFLDDLSQKPIFVLEARNGGKNE